MKQLKKILDKFANLLNFLHFQPLISSEAAASPASPVPTPLNILVTFPSHLKKLPSSIPRSWLEKLNCGFLHSFHSWKNTTKWQNNFSSQNFSVENNYSMFEWVSLRVVVPMKYDVWVLSYPYCVSTVSSTDTVSVYTNYYYWITYSLAD